MLQSGKKKGLDTSSFSCYLSSLWHFYVHFPLISSEKNLMRNTTKNGVTADQFISIWNDIEHYPNSVDVANKLGWTYALVSNHAFRLRSAGYPLIKRKTGRPQGINRAYIIEMKKTTLERCLIREGIENNWSTKKNITDLASSLKVSRTTIYNKLKEMKSEGIVLENNDEKIEEILKVWQDDTIEVCLSDIVEKFDVSLHFIKTRIYPITSMEERSKMNLFVRNRKFIEDWNDIISFPSVSHLSKYGTRFGVCMKAKELRKHFSFVINRRSKK